MVNFIFHIKSIPNDEAQVCAHASVFISNTTATEAKAAWLRWLLRPQRDNNMLLASSCSGGSAHLDHDCDDHAFRTVLIKVAPAALSAVFFRLKKPDFADKPNGNVEAGFHSGRWHMPLAPQPRPRCRPDPFIM